MWTAIHITSSVGLKGPKNPLFQLIIAGASMLRHANGHVLSLLEPPFQIVKKDKVLIVDDDEGMRQTLTVILKDEYTVLTAGSGEEALTKMNHDIQVVLLDIRLPGIDGVKTLEQLVADYPDIQCIMISAVHAATTIVECIRKGAYDYMTKEFEYDAVRLRVRNAIMQAKLRKLYGEQARKLMILEDQLNLKRPEHATKCYRNCGKRIFLSQETETVDPDTLDGPPALVQFFLRCMEGEDLTVQEQVVLALLLRGFSNKEIARSLNIGLPTVKTHLKNAFQKLGVLSRSQVFAYLLQKGLKEISYHPKG